MSTILNLVNLNKSFDGVVPIQDVSFAINKKDIVLISGENGTGKTTLFNLITGLEKPTLGKIIFNGHNIESKSALEISKKGLVRLYQQPRIFKNLLVWENLVAAAHNPIENSLVNLIFNYKKVRDTDEIIKQKAFGLLSKFGLKNLSNDIAGELSYGQQKLISFCMLIMNETQLALLDEPFAGLNPQTIDQFSQMIMQLNKEGVTFLIIEHNTNQALKICNQHIEMKEGKIKIIKHK